MSEPLTTDKELDFRIPDLEFRRDADWVSQNPDLEQRYGGLWVVAYRHEIVASGTDPVEVRRQAADKTGLPPESLIVCAIPSSGDLIP
jgi:hypothetical protein